MQPSPQRRRLPNPYYHASAQRANAVMIIKISLLLVGVVIGIVLSASMVDPMASPCSLNSNRAYSSSSSSSYSAAYRDRDRRRRRVSEDGKNVGDAVGEYSSNGPVRSFVQLDRAAGNDAYQPVDRIVRSSRKHSRKLPHGRERTFFAHGSKICNPMVRALRDLGWIEVPKKDDARFIYTYTRYKSWYPTFESWQRYNHIPRTYVWNRKDAYAAGMRNYSRTVDRPAYFLPETYNLDRKNELAEFKDRLYNGGGLDVPWVLKRPNVNQGKGITMLGPRTPELEGVFEKVGETEYIIQQYICNEMTWDTRKFDARMYWLVASMDPLIVFYIDGYARVGNADYDETDFTNTRNHLTTHTFLGEEGKGSFDQIEERVTEIYDRRPDLQRQFDDPVRHVRNQFKESLAQTVDAFKHGTFQKFEMSVEDSFEFYGADYVLDNDLDVWLIEPQDDTGMDEDHNFRLDMHHQIFYGMATILEEIWDKQAAGKPILPIRNTGKWELIYADGWKFEYEGYERDMKAKKTCTLPPSTQKGKKTG